MVTQKITHVRKVEHTSEIPSAIYWWTLKSPKNQTFGKMKKIAGDIIILHMCTKNHNHMRYSSWDTEWHKMFCHFGLFFTFLTPSPPNNPEHQNFEKMKKASGDVIILNLCNKKHDHIMYAYSDMECNRHNFSSFQAIFCSFATLLTLKVKIWKKCKKSPGDIILLHMCTTNQDHMMYSSWDMKCNKQNFFVILGNLLPFYPPNSMKNENIKNEKKNPGDIIILHKCTKNHDHLLCSSREMVRDRCNCYFHFGLYSQTCV